MKKVWLALLIIQALVNLIGALGPELGFDALWYHLTEGKLFLAHKSIVPIPGNLLYWSGFPRLMEIIYAVTPAKLVHWAFGLGSAWLVYRLGGAAAAVLFYSTLLVGWLSTTAYVDLALTFFILAALNTRKLIRIFWLSLAGAIKLTAIPISLVLTGFPWAILGALPFWLINWRSTGNPFYPFSPPTGGFAPVQEWFYGGFGFWLSRPIRLFFDPAFRAGPIILILVVLSWPSIRYLPLAISLFLVWFLGPGTDTGRFALPLLAVLSLSAARNKSRLATLLILIHVAIGIGSRAYANAKYLPLILGQQTKDQFLTRHLNFDFGDFYDTDGWFAANIKTTDRVLIYDIHNLYYVNFPYDHESWAKPGTYYTHVLSRHSQALPLIYTNPVTGVKVYKL